MNWKLIFLVGLVRLSPIPRDAQDSEIAFGLGLGATALVLGTVGGLSSFRNSGIALMKGSQKALAEELPLVQSQGRLMLAAATEPIILPPAMATIQKPIIVSPVKASISQKLTAPPKSGVRELMDTILHDAGIKLQKPPGDIYEEFGKWVDLRKTQEQTVESKRFLNLLPNDYKPPPLTGFTKSSNNHFGQKFFEVQQPLKEKLGIAANANSDLKVTRRVRFSDEQPTTIDPKFRSVNIAKASLNDNTGPLSLSITKIIDPATLVPQQLPIKTQPSFMHNTADDISVASSISRSSSIDSSDSFKSAQDGPFKFNAHDSNGPTWHNTGGLKIGNDELLKPSLNSLIWKVPNSKNQVMDSFFASNQKVVDSNALTRSIDETASSKASQIQFGHSKAVSWDPFVGDRNLDII